MKSGKDFDPIETREWIESLDDVIDDQGTDRASFLLNELAKHLMDKGAVPSYNLTTPFKNTISPENEAMMPGDLFMERRIRSLIRWNALATVLRANKNDDELGGHIATFSSAAMLYDIGFNYFFRGQESENDDLVYFQGHSSPGIYARSFLEGRLSEEDLDNFRREVDKPGLSSYPHPWLMPDYWQFPVVSMGLGPISAIYQAHVMKYLHARGLKDLGDRKIWGFWGDGEMDEPESLGAIGLAAREKLDNLIFVINCNLQRLDGPVRGNGKVIQELERQFRGSGWNVIKVVWGRLWDPIMAKDKGGHLQKIMDEVVDGEMQNFKAKGGAYTRENFFGKHPEALKLVKGLSDEEIYKLNRGGHDPYKVYAAYHEAVNHKGAPSVILALTTKGYGVGSREADNTTHQVKKLSIDNIKSFRDRFDIPVSDDEIEDLPYVRPKEDSPEIKYLKETREKLGGPVPKRREHSETLKLKNKDAFKVLYEGSGERKVSTTTNCVRIMNNLIKDENLGERVVPIVPDEARTFGMEGMFKQIGIYSSEGQLYEPEDADQVMWYKESETGVMLEEGITEAGSFAAWTALATSYSNHNLTMIPFYVFYSMFGFQRIHDLAWAAGDAQAKGFLIGATSGRTTLNGEGLQHQDGHSHILSSTIPNCKSYDPAYGYELAVIIEHGLKEMYKDKQNYFYYLTVTNERYVQPPKPKGMDVDSNIIKGMHRISKTKKPQIRLLGSGAILNESIKAAEMLSGFEIESEVWSVSSFNMLRKDGMEVENENIKNASNKAKESFVAESFSEHDIPTVASTDYMRAYSEQIRPYIDSSYFTLGTDGFGRSDSREKLREFFEVDAKSIVMTAAYALYKEGQLNKKELQNIYKEIKVKKNKISPWNK
tara:strand:+ start:283 stop:2928 length:2646 start_codon:yes stop_codon:yes gene_type:complete